MRKNEYKCLDDFINEYKEKNAINKCQFKSKEEILDAMIERLSNEITSKATSIALDESIPVLKRITNTIL